MTDPVLALTAFGAIMPARPRSKEPATRHGVKDATRDPMTIQRWKRSLPGCNWAVATGYVVDVVDIDDLQAAQLLAAQLRELGGPLVETARGAHFYVRSAGGATVKIPGGEIRRRGSYVLAPPSVHPSGEPYVWAVDPTAPLPTLPNGIAAVASSSAGCGDHRAPVGRVPHGERHGYLVDLALRMARSGILDEQVLLEHVRLEFQLRCEPHPPPSPGSLEALVAWALGTRIAERERRWSS